MHPESLLNNLKKKNNEMLECQTHPSCKPPNNWNKIRNYYKT